MPWMENNGVRIYYELYGYGLPIVFFSGVGGGTWSWYKQISYFEKKYEIVVYDNRGSGRSDKPREPYSMEDFVSDGCAILNKLAMWKVFIVGVSMGGMIAQTFALKYPERVMGMVLGATHCGGSIRIAPSPEVLACFMDNEGLSEEEIIDKNVTILFGPKFLLEHQEEVEEYKRVHLSVGIQPQYALENQLGAIREFSCCNELHKLDVPTLIIAGESDVLVPVENSKILEERLPNSRVVLLPEAGHAIHIEAADVFNRLVDDFFSELA